MRSTIRMPNSITDFYSCDRFTFLVQSQLIVTRRFPLESSALGKIKITKKKKKNRKKTTQQRCRPTVGQGQAEQDQTLAAFIRQERGAIKRQKEGKRGKKRGRKKNEIYFSHLSRERAYGVLSETFIFLQSDVHEHNKGRFLDDKLVDGLHAVQC